MHNLWKSLELEWKLALLAGIGNVLVIGFITLAQRDLKQMLGYSSVMHMGYCFLGLACLSTIGIGGVRENQFAGGVVPLSGVLARRGSV